MAGTGRKFAVAQSVQLAAHCRLRKRDLESVAYPLAKVAEPPAHEAINDRIWTALDNCLKRCPMAIVEP